MGILEEYHIWEHIISIKISIKYQYQNISLKEYHIREWKKNMSCRCLKLEII